MNELLAVREKCSAQIIAVCDVWKVNREAAIARVKQASGCEPKSFTRFGDLLAWSEVDAVVIATPDFSHAPILLAALEAKKDVYVEKPMTLDVASANQAIDLARANRCVVQTGTQRRSEGRFLAAAKFISTGALGKINRISGAMNVNAARWARRFDDCQKADVDWEAFCMGRIQQPFDPRRFRCWQLFRDTTNGIPGLWMTHYVDAVHMLTGAKYPASVVWRLLLPRKLARPIANNIGLLFSKKGAAGAAPLRRMRACVKSIITLSCCWRARPSRCAGPISLN